MDISLSQRLADLRKKNHLSQEALAEKLALSRQAISKWERGESLPDTENLIALAGIYGISLDELLGKTPEEETQPEVPGTEPPAETDSGIITVTDTEEAGEEETFVEDSGKKKQKKPKKPKKIKEPMLRPGIHSVLLKIPVFIIVPIIYVLLGFAFKVWHPGWLILLLIPIYYLICWAFGARSKKSFYLRVPVFLVTVLVFLALGFSFSMWKTAWIVFLINPLYYWFASVFNKGR